MLSVFKKEINTFFSSLIGYIVIGVFLLILGLVIWVFPDTSLLNYNYATLDQLFDIAPIIFTFLIPALTMRSFSEENATGTIELLLTRPLTDLQIVLGKYSAVMLLLVFALLPTVLYYYTVYELGSPRGNLDSGAIMGSYIGLILLAGCFAAMGLLASVLTKDQISAFLLGMLLCFLFYWGFWFFSKLPFFVGTSDDIIQMIGIDYHYISISRGVIDTRDVVYFLSFIGVFIAATVTVSESRKW